jgi:hypothetical protein
MSAEFERHAGLNIPEPETAPASLDPQFPWSIIPFNESFYDLHKLADEPEKPPMVNG